MTTHASTALSSNLTLHGPAPLHQPASPTVSATSGYSIDIRCVRASEFGSVFCSFGCLTCAGTHRQISFLRAAVLEAFARVYHHLPSSVRFRRDLQTKSHPRHTYLRTHHRHSTPLYLHSYHRSSPAVPARAHVPVYAVLPLFAHLEIPAQCRPPQSRNQPDKGPGRPRGLVRLRVARAGWRNRLV